MILLIVEKRKKIGLFKITMYRVVCGNENIDWLFLLRGTGNDSEMSPQNLWPAVGRLERLWGKRKTNCFDWLLRKGSVYNLHFLPQDFCGEKIPNFSRRPTTGQRTCQVRT